MKPKVATKMRGIVKYIYYYPNSSRRREFG
jgi:hypothetical protein